MKELYPVIWGLRTQPSKATTQSPFFMVYGLEAVLPVDKLYGAPRLQHYNEGEWNNTDWPTSTQWKNAASQHSSITRSTYRGSAAADTGFDKLIVMCR